MAFHLRRATRIVTRRYAAFLKDTGMTAFQFSALAALSDRGAVPQGLLAQDFGMDASTAHRNLRAMAQKGWVAYADDKRDGRKKSVAITAKGRRAFQEAVPHWEEAQAETRKLMAAFDWSEARQWLQAVSGETAE